MDVNDAVDVASSGRRIKSRKAGHLLNCLWIQNSDEYEKENRFGLHLPADIKVRCGKNKLLTR